MQRLFLCPSSNPLSSFSSNVTSYAGYKALASDVDNEEDKVRIKFGNKIAIDGFQAIEKLLFPAQITAWDGASEKRFAEKCTQTAGCMCESLSIEERIQVAQLVAERRARQV